MIATAIGGIAESMSPGESGLLVPQRDSEALASAILRIAKHPENWGRMGRAGRAHVEGHFSLNKLHDELVEIYRKVQASWV